MLVAPGRLELSLEGPLGPDLSLLIGFPTSSRGLPLLLGCPDLLGVGRDEFIELFR